MQMDELYNLFLASTGITTDTRNIGEGNIFFALKGERFNANEFAEQAIMNGAAYVVVDEVFNKDWREKYGKRIIEVNNVLETLQQLARVHRQNFNATVIGITGSNGKTTTKELVAAVLARRYNTYATKGNLNNHIGIPLTLLAIDKEKIEMAVVEMGANHQKEIEGYCEYALPDYGLITNVGYAHLEGFGGFEGVIKGKTELYSHLIKTGGNVFINADNEILINRTNEQAGGVAGWDKNERLITYGTGETCFCTGSIAPGGDFLNVEVDGIRVHTNLVGNYNFENVLAAVCIGKHFDVPVEDIKAAIESYVPSNNRSQQLQWGNNTVIMDAYNANPSSMQEALKNFDRLSAENKVTILGEMMELGEYAAEEHRRIKELTDVMDLKQRVFTGGGFSFLKDDSSVLYFENTELLKDWFINRHFEDTYILVKGSRKNELEKLVKN